MFGGAEAMLDIVVCDAKTVSRGANARRLLLRLAVLGNENKYARVTGAVAPRHVRQKWRAHCQHSLMMLGGSRTRHLAHIRLSYAPAL